MTIKTAVASAAIVGALALGVVACGGSTPQTVKLTPAQSVCKGQGVTCTGPGFVCSDGAVCTGSSPAALRRIPLQQIITQINAEVGAASGAANDMATLGLLGATCRIGTLANGDIQMSFYVGSAGYLNFLGTGTEPGRSLGNNQNQPQPWATVNACTLHQDGVITLP